MKRELRSSALRRWFGSIRGDFTIKNLQLREIGTLLLFLGILSSMCLQADPMDEVFDAANLAYNRGAYSEAIVGYETLLTSRNSASVLNNLGNACFFSGRVGAALGYWREALKLEPRATDTRESIRRGVKRLDRSYEDLFAPGEEWLGRLSLNEWLGLALASVWVFSALGLARTLSPAIDLNTRGYLVASGALAVAVVGLSAVAAWWGWFRPPGVVIAKEAVVQVSPVTEASAIGKLNEGETVRVIRRYGEWWQIQSGGKGQRGWIRGMDLKVIADSKRF